MRIKNFEDILSWQEGKLLYGDISTHFRNLKDYSFKDQILRATLSITNNIAEGFDRGTDKELRKFLYIARGSCAEVRSMLHIAKEARYITDDQYKLLTERTIKISKLLTGFISKLATGDSRQETSS